MNWKDSRRTWCNRPLNASLRNVRAHTKTLKAKQREFHGDKRAERSLQFTESHTSQREPNLLGLWKKQIRKNSQSVNWTYLCVVSVGASGSSAQQWIIFLSSGTRPWMQRVDTKQRQLPFIGHSKIEYYTRLWCVNLLIVLKTFRFVLRLLLVFEAVNGHGKKQTVRGSRVREKNAWNTHLLALVCVQMCSCVSKLCMCVCLRTEYVKL